jgi:hypothetical protein
MPWYSLEKRTPEIIPLDKYVDIRVVYYWGNYVFHSNKVKEWHDDI